MNAIVNVGLHEGLEESHIEVQVCPENETYHFVTYVLHVALVF